MSASHGTSTPIKKRIAAYGAAATAAIAATATQDAEAIIHYSGANRDIAVGLNASMNLDLDEMGVDDFTFENVYNRFNNGTFSYQEGYGSDTISGTRFEANARLSVFGLTAGNSVAVSGPTYVARLSSSNRFSSNASLDSSARLGFRFQVGKQYQQPSEYYRTLSSDSDGPFGVGGAGFIGVIFQKDGNSHHGWVRLTVDPKDLTAVINDWAWEDVAGESIHIGSTSGGATPTPAVPEPAALGLLALGAAGIAATRRRRVDASSR